MFFNYHVELATVRTVVCPVVDVFKALAPEQCTQADGTGRSSRSKEWGSRRLELRDVYPEVPPSFLILHVLKEFGVKGILRFQDRRPDVSQRERRVELSVPSVASSSLVANAHDPGTVLVVVLELDADVKAAALHLRNPKVRLKKFQGGLELVFASEAGDQRQPVAPAFDVAGQVLVAVLADVDHEVVATSHEGRDGVHGVVLLGSEPRVLHPDDRICARSGEEPAQDLIGQPLRGEIVDWTHDDDPLAVPRGSDRNLAISLKVIAILGPKRVQASLSEACGKPVLQKGTEVQRSTPEVSDHAHGPDDDPPVQVLMVQDEDRTLPCLWGPGHRQR